MGFQWDLAKDVANIAKHGISFRQAIEIFHGPVLRKIDDRRNYGETRWIALGLSGGLHLRVVYTLRDGDIRIISAWRASRDDSKIYEEFVKLGPGQPH